MTQAMTQDSPLAELWRGPFAESLHRGHAVISAPDGRIVDAWGDGDAVVLPRSSVKMVQALPLMESGAGAGLGTAQMALACASHSGAAVHVDLVSRWVGDLGLSERDLRCGAQPSGDRTLRHAMIREGRAPCQFHNNCSGKHAGFLMLGQHLGGGPDYVDPDHPVQRAVRLAFEEMTGAPSPGFGIDGCSAPNFAARLSGIAQAMARFAAARTDAADTRSRAAARLVDAMIAHPDLVAGKGRACSELMQAAQGRAVIKTGAEGVYTALVPAQKLGIALKVSDGATRAAECAIAAILVRLGVLDANDPLVQKRLFAPEINRRGLQVGQMRPAPGLLDVPVPTATG